MATVEYTIQRGDMLKEIAARYGVSIWDIADANGIENPDLIIAGKTLVIPQPARDAQTGATASGAGTSNDSGTSENSTEPRAPAGGQGSSGSADARSGAQEPRIERQPHTWTPPARQPARPTGSDAPPRTEATRSGQSTSRARTQPASRGASVWERYGVNEFELEVVRLVNQIRRSYGLRELDVSVMLTRAARGHATHMARRGVMAHDGIGDGTAESRVRGVGFRGAWGENVARGQTTPAQVVREWMASSSHRRNILDPRWNIIAVEMSYGADGRPFWSQNFGQR